MGTTTKTDGKGNIIVIPDLDYYNEEGRFRKQRKGGDNRKKTSARKKYRNQ